MPETQEFRPAGRTACGAPVILTVDEYEAVRLIDRQGFSQEECSSYMQVARTTVQMIYTSARRKLAEALVDGRPLRIEGGATSSATERKKFAAAAAAGGTGRTARSGWCRRRRR